MIAVVLRRFQRPEVARLLDDDDPLVAAEAARAIYDEPIPAALPALAARLERPLPEDVYFQRRAVCANVRLGDEAAARRIAQWLARGEGTTKTREEAFYFLTRWEDPFERDPITGEYGPLERRDAPYLAAIADELAPSFARTRPSTLAAAWAWFATSVRAEGCRATLRELFDDRQGCPSRVRRAILGGFVEQQLEGFEDMVQRALEDDDRRLRSEAFSMLSRFEPERSLVWIEPALEAAEPEVRQAAFAALGQLEGPQAESLLAGWVDRLTRGEVQAAIALDVLEAAEAHGGASLVAGLEAYRASLAAQDDLAAWRACLEGGDASRGRKVFLENAAVSCLKCHKMGERGGSEAGPQLAGVANRMPREGLLRSIVFPNAELAEGFETWILRFDDDSLLVGRILEEDESQLVVQAKEGEELVEWEVPLEEVVERKRDVSSMPADLTEHLSRRELRDLVAFLATLDEEQE